MDKFNIVKINVGGQIFVTKKSTLQRFSDTKLASISSSCEFHDEKSDEFYFDRNPVIFHSILDFYRTGRLHFASNICAENIREELEYWELSTSSLKPCCWKNFYTLDTELKTAGVIEQHFEVNDGSSMVSHSSYARNKIWNVLEHPWSSRTAMLWHIFYMVIVCVAVAVSIVESFELSTELQAPNNGTFHDIKARLTEADHSAEVITHICNVIFALETIIRLATCPNKLEFAKSFLNIVDVVSVTGYFIFVVIQIIPEQGAQYDGLFIFFYILVILRGFRFFRLERFFEGLRLMLLSIKESKRMLFLLIIILLITSIIFGITMHVLEMEVESSAFADPIGCIYWAIITMTTIGYGDKYPRTPYGQVVASLCATVGVFLLSMPIAVVANTFTELYGRYTLQNNHLSSTKKSTCKSYDQELVSMKY